MTAHPGEDPEIMLEEMDRAECESLIAATRYGRIAVVDGGRPTIVVLNHVVLRGSVLFRVAEDNRLAELTEGYAVHACYEVDSAFPVGRSGWSVIADGILEREADPELVTCARQQIAAWAGGHRDTVLRLRVDHLTGRRAGPT
jgi:nitroimidazol reductase NimA-like FMN-containing flavoprotein (pyridoxamine 5'-phosphate oxidase superfamily)